MDGSPSAERKTILVAEDEAPIRKLIRKTLTSLGYEVLDTDRTDEALLLAAGSPRPIDMLVADSLTEEPMSGAQLATELTRLHPDLKVLFISGYANEELRKPVRLAKGQAWLQKPFSMAELSQRIREMLDES